jgi:glycosyltransferase 2 family protein
VTSPVGAGPNPELDDARPVVELFDPPRAQRTFAPADLVRLLIGVGLIAVGAVVGRLARATIQGIELDLIELVGQLPDPVGDVLIQVAVFVTRVVPAVALVVLLVTRRWRVAILLVAAGWLADIAMAGVDVLLFDRTLTELVELLRGADPEEGASPGSHVLASTTAIVTVVAAWSSRVWRRALWSVVVVVTLLRLLAVTEPAFDVIAAIGVGLVVGSAILMLFGSPSNEPHPDELLAGLEATGLAPRRIEREPPVGSARHYRVTDGSNGGDRQLEVALRTPDERDADLLTRALRRLRFTDAEIDPGYTTVERRIEHEALALVLAERRGVRAPRLVTVGGTARGAAFLVTAAADARPVTEDDLRSPAFLDSLWTLVRDLHAADLAHRRLGLDAIRVTSDGFPTLRILDQAHVGPAPRERARDVAQLLTETAIVVGPADATAAALAVLGPEPVADSLRMLQPLALSSATRSRAKAAGPVLEELRAEISRVTGEPDVEVERLERVRPRTLLIIGASTIAFYALLPQLANLGDTVDAFGEAQPVWLLAALAASVLSYIFAAVSFQGAVSQPLAFTANLRSQTASSFAGLVGPGGAGGYALNARFLQRNGLRPAEAAASVTVVGLAGFAMHAVLLIGFVSWTRRAGDAGPIGLGAISLPTGSTVLLVLAVVLAIAGVALAFGPVRSRVVGPVLGAVRTGLSQIATVFRNPVRVVGLFGGATGISLAYVAAITCAVHAFGGGISVAQIGTAYLLAAALATLAPTPGGLGALEAALIAGLTGFGLASGPAVAAVLSYRLVTFWLPILPGWLSFAWMQRNGEI